MDEEVKVETTEEEKVEKIVEEKIEDKVVSQKKPWYKQPKCIVLMVAIAFVMLFNINYTVVLVSGPSMEPNYQDANVLLAERHYDYLQRFDVVVIYSEVAQKTLIKRVIGLPGETVEYKGNMLYINGEPTYDAYNYGGTEDFSVTLDSEHYFCLGDNRTNSADSRVYGNFTEDDIFAKVFGKQHVGIDDIKKQLTK